MQWNADTHGLRGKTFYTEGVRSWEIEERLDKTITIWRGKEPSPMIKGNAEARGQLDDWMEPLEE